MVLLIAVLASLGIFPSGGAPGASAGFETAPVERLQNPDGTLDLNTGYSGALDPTGWQAALDATRGPVITGRTVQARDTSRAPGASGHSDTPTTRSSSSQTLGWSALPNGGLNNYVTALAVRGSDLYVGGDFTGTADGAVTNLNCIAKLSGGVWSTLPNGGLNGTVAAIAMSGSDLYVGGAFTATADSAVTNLNNIAKLSGGVWSALPNGGLDKRVLAFAARGDDLYVGGYSNATFDGSVTNLIHVARLRGG